MYSHGPSSNSTIAMIGIRAYPDAHFSSRTYRHETMVPVPQHGTVWRNRQPHSGQDDVSGADSLPHPSQCRIVRHRISVVRLSITLCTSRCLGSFDQYRRAAWKGIESTGAYLTDSPDVGACTTVPLPA